MNQYNVSFDDGGTEIIIAYSVNYDARRKTALFDLGPNRSLYLTHVINVEVVG